MPPLHYWSEVRALCDRLAALLIFDDVPSGLGKTGRLFSCQRFADFHGTTPGRAGEQHARDALYGLLRRGLLAMPPKANALSFSIRLIISGPELDEALAIVEDALAELSKADV